MIEIQNIDIMIPPEVTAGLSTKAVNSIIGDIATAARAHWVKLASKDPSSYRNDYLRGIQRVRMRDDQAIITLVGEVPHMLEDGMPQTDLRDLLLGHNVPVVPRGERGKHLNKKGGFYRAIPFRHTTPTAGSVVGQPMGQAYSASEAVSDARKLGRQVYKAAKALKPTTTNPYGKTAWGSRLDTSTMQIPLLREHHKSDIYAGMVRQEKTYEQSTQSQYTTFRTISTSVKTGWIRQRIEARNYGEKVSQFVQKIAPMAFQAYVESQT